MHILLVTNYFAPDSGAAAVRLTRLARLLAGRGHRVTVLTSLPHYPQGRVHDRYRGWWWVVERRGGLRVVQSWLWATSSPKISRRLVSQASFMLSAALRGLALPRPDVVLIEAQPVFTGLAGVWLSLVKRAPYILNVSDLWPDHLLSVGALTEMHPVYRSARAVVDFTYRRAAAIVAMSPAWAEAIAGYVGSGEKLRVIYNGVDLRRFRPGLNASAFRQQHGIDSNTKVVSFIGAFTTQNDFDTLLAVTERLRNRPDVRFLFAGGGTQDAYLRGRLAAGDLPNVHLAGWVDFEAVPLAWGASQLTYLALRDHPLYRGTIPAKFYEAMACGVPVAAAIEGVGAGMLQESGAGLAVPCGDVDGLSEAVGRLLDDAGLRDECSASARAYAEQHFDPDAVAGAYERVLATACHSSTARL